MTGSFSLQARIKTFLYMVHASILAVRFDRCAADSTGMHDHLHSDITAGRVTTTKRTEP